MAAEGPDDLARTGVDHLQAAARELIAAARSFLDAAEELVEDPAAVQHLVQTLGGLAQAAARRLRHDDDSDDGDDGGGVERIEVG